ncbi:site-specific integrase [Salmonirosea aquatica]|uniref:Core-binding (CB) domain-containing protein n=1 Tax=Salmonirosea aquatica TaxID=2654236 RepID=A0A7C9BDV7_9BACT|nr:hypothetical protein [Cytophagaceae bacterium SJW1-29]
MTKLTKKPGFYSVRALYRLKITGAGADVGSLYLRIVVNGIRSTERSTGIRVASKQWDSKSQSILGNDRETQLKNAQLHQIRTRIYEAQRELEQLGETVTWRKIIERVFDQPRQATTLADVFGLYVTEQKATTSNSPVTFQGYEKYFRNLSTYFAENGLKSPLLDDITKARFQNLLVWLKDRYAQDYAIKNAQFLKSLFSYAYACNLIDRNPLTTIRLEKSGHYDTSHLTQEQVQQLASFDFVELPLPVESIRVLDEERDVFVFCCYTGLHHADYHKGTFAVSEQKGRTWLSGHRIKSQGGRKDKPYSMPLHPLAVAILAKYGDVARLPRRNNAKRNLVLKQIAAYVGLNVHLTTKIARKTLANYCLNVLGMRLETVAKVLGHSSTKFVKHYTTITDDSIDREMQFEPSKPTTK